MTWMGLILGEFASTLSVVAAACSVLVDRVSGASERKRAVVFIWAEPIRTFALEWLAVTSRLAAKSHHDWQEQIEALI